MMERGAPDGSRCVARPGEEGSSHRPTIACGQRGERCITRVNSTQPKTPCGAPQEKASPQLSAEERASSKIEARIKNDATTASNARHRIIALRTSPLQVR